jgi:hypothetical protein
MESKLAQPSLREVIPPGETNAGFVLKGRGFQLRRQGRWKFAVSAS